MSIISHERQEMLNHILLLESQGLDSLSALRIHRQGHGYYWRNENTAQTGSLILKGFRNRADQWMEGWPFAIMEYFDRDIYSGPVDGTYPVFTVDPDGEFQPPNPDREIDWVFLAFLQSCDLGKAWFHWYACAYFRNIDVFRNALHVGKPCDLVFESVRMYSASNRFNMDSLNLESTEISVDSS